MTRASCCLMSLKASCSLRDGLQVVLRPGSVAVAAWSSSCRRSWSVLVSSVSSKGMVAIASSRRCVETSLAVATHRGCNVGLPLINRQRRRCPVAGWSGRWRWRRPGRCSRRRPAAVARSACVTRCSNIGLAVLAPGQAVVGFGLGEQLGRSRRRRGCTWPGRSSSACTRRGRCGRRRPMRDVRLAELEPLLGQSALYSPALKPQAMAAAVSGGRSPPSPPPPWARL